MKTRLVPHEEGLMKIFFEGSEYLVRNGEIISELYAKDVQELDLLRKKVGLSLLAPDLSARWHLVYDRIIDSDFASKLEKLLDQGLVIPKTI